jgi:opacity protein-like surface antigen
MKKQVIIFALLCCCITGFSQNSDYQKLVFSISGGMNFPWGKNGSQIDFTRPYSKEDPFKGSPILFPAQKGFTGNIEAAYYFSRHWGLGITYLYDDSNVNSEESNWVPSSLNNPENRMEATQLEFDENHHFIAPAFFGRWKLDHAGKWALYSSLAVGYLYCKLSDIEGIRAYRYSYPTDHAINLELGTATETYGLGYPDIDNFSVGFNISAGIAYHINDNVGILLKASELYSHVPRMSRNINRLGITAGVSFSF